MYSLHYFFRFLILSVIKTKYLPYPAIKGKIDAFAITYARTAQSSVTIMPS